MRRYWLGTFLTICVFASFCESGQARGRRRCCPPCGYSCFCYCPTPPVAARDRRLQTEKRNIPDFDAHRELTASTFHEPDGDTFTVRQHKRGRAKTTYANAPMEEFANLDDLIVTLADDAEMFANTQGKWDFDRIAPERRNVRVTAFLFAIGKETDNDFHLVVDDDGSIEEGAKLNVEISGVPTEGPDVDHIRAVRDFFKNRFGGHPPTEYTPFQDPPLKVIIEGSLFFDHDHQAGAVGPLGFRPSTSWEIHPVHRIEFLNQ